jgi:hypothetical protein
MSNDLIPGFSYEFANNALAELKRVIVDLRDSRQLFQNFVRQYASPDAEELRLRDILVSPAVTPEHAFRFLNTHYRSLCHHGVEPRQIEHFVTKNGILKDDCVFAVFSLLSAKHYYLYEKKYD